MKTDGSEAAFARPYAESMSGSFSTEEYGLTKREYFAVMILQGIKASTPGCASEDCAFLAVKQADELIKSLNEEKKS